MVECIRSMERLTLSNPIEFSSLLDALPVLLVLVGFTCIGACMVLFPEGARRFMDESLKRGDSWFNRKESRQTPKGLPRLLGVVFVVLTLALAVILVLTVLT